MEVGDEPAGRDDLVDRGDRIRVERRVVGDGEDSSRCSTVRGPTIGLVTPGRSRSHSRASWPGVMSRSSARRPTAFAAAIACFVTRRRNPAIRSALEPFGGLPADL